MSKIFKTKTLQLNDNGKQIAVKLQYKIDQDGSFNIKIPAPVGFILKSKLKFEDKKHQHSLKYMHDENFHDLKTRVEKWCVDWVKGRKKTTKVILYKMCYFGDINLDRHTNYGSAVAMNGHRHQHSRYGVGITMKYEIAYLQSFLFDGDANDDMDNKKYYCETTCSMDEHIGNETQLNYKVMEWTEEKETWFKEQEYFLRQLMKQSYEYLNKPAKELETIIKNSQSLLEPPTNQTNNINQINK